MYQKLINNAFKEHNDVAIKTIKLVAEKIEKSSSIISESLLNKGTIFWCGNGGSAADSQHIAAEFIGRFKKDRKPLKSIALTTDTSVLTCISNDYNYESVFSRQLRALGLEGDVLVAISTSGESKNVKKVLIEAKKMGIKTIGLLGKKGGICKNYADMSLIVPSNNTARIQEMHILIAHLLCELVEKKLGLS